MRTRRLSSYERRHRRQARMGLLLILSTFFAFGTLLAAAITVDVSRGITASESLEQWGL